MQNEELARKLPAATKEERKEILGQLFSNNKGIIARICYRWASAKDYEFNDLFQTAYFSLVRSADRYAAAKNADIKYTTYLTNMLNWDLLRFFKQSKYLYYESLTLDAPLDSGDSDGDSRLDLIADEKQNVETAVLDNLYSAAVRNIFIKTIADYPPPIKLVLESTLIEGHTFKQTAAGIGKSRQWVQTLYRQGIRRLHNSNIKALLAENEYRESLGSAAYKLSGYSFWKNTGFSSVEFIAIKMDDYKQKTEYKETHQKSNNSRDARRQRLYGNIDIF